MAAKKKVRKRPKLRKVGGDSTPATPEALFISTTGRAKTHGYLRGPQQDVLRDYANLDPRAENVALELPTGTGKTAVGLLIAEWWRRKHKRRTAYLALNNQLAAQVLAEAEQLGIRCANLIGSKATRSAAEEGRFRSAEAVAVSSYANLFNVKPVIAGGGLIVLDDAHGGGQSCLANWTVRIRKSAHEEFYEEAFNALTRVLSRSEIEMIEDEERRDAVELCDVPSDGAALREFRRVLDRSEIDEVRFPWSEIRHNLDACLFLVSGTSITVRPLVPPTHTHEPFFSASQRVFMSATLGNPGDLCRAYGIEQPKVLKAQHAQWGRRYIFVPELYADSGGAMQAVAATWEAIEPKRATILAPSFRLREKVVAAIMEEMETEPTVLSAEDVAETLEPFTSADSVVLALAGRYDGLDLPDDDCRLLIMFASPSATDDLERHLRSRWKLGPILRRRERTRLIQGMGRCTRNATDFAVVFWLEQSLVEAATNPDLVGRMPPELRAELIWGAEQSKSGETDPTELAEVAIELLDDPGFRDEADQLISEIQASEQPEDAAEYDEAAVLEVRFSAAMWAGDFEKAHEVAREAVDALSGDEMQGYRSWWWLLTSLAARHLGDDANELDALRRARECGVNGGWLMKRIRGVSGDESAASEDGVANSEGIWDYIGSIGWAGPKFKTTMEAMLSDLGNSAHKSFHRGLEVLGRACGAVASRPKGQGVPDVVWRFPERAHWAFEAKTEKKGGALSKKDIQQAAGHVNWLENELPEEAVLERRAIIVAATKEVAQPAKPHVADLRHIAPAAVLEFAQHVAKQLGKLRAAYTGKDYPAVRAEFDQAVQDAGLDLEGLRSVVLTEWLGAPAAEDG